MTLIRFMCVAAIAFAGYWFGWRDGCGTRGALACPAPALEEGVGSALSAAEVCPSSGYLCFGRQRFQVLRWPLDKGRLRVRVSLPEFLEPETARAVRDAAVDGIMEWDHRPFPLVVDTARYGLRLADINVVWSLGGDYGEAGLARVTTFPEGKRLRFSIDGLAIRVPPMPGMIAGSDPVAQLLAQAKAMSGAPEAAPPLERVRATAAHEMGHALGLMHSDGERDIMFAEMRHGTSRLRASERDFATVEALYGLPNGAMVQ